MNMCIVIVFNVKWKGVWSTCLEERSPMCLGVIENTCFTVYIVLLGYYQIFESPSS